MIFWQTIFSNHVLINTFWGWAAAQLIKSILYLATYRKFNAGRLVGSGGMPSSHSAAVSALAVTAGLKYGIDSYEFAFSVIIACIVMYDACGVRRAAGEHAKLLNKLQYMWTDKKSPDEKFKEMIGHTPLQVIVGSIIGILVAAILY
ncbi:divergent PAP2 family protein [Oxobacter pfennigii]|uniref:Divergent PAP2 family protein n=1 Tax=Oxobacter pfennigii TaxID=36849 RepID=A0A0P8WLB9_9CLOT|nr:divergent PAP2 family protein [Oxobacter pfennigii]KPU43198.1 divergent PAP2 family protein [Oxobacter pfennigii]